MFTPLNEHSTIYWFRSAILKLFGSMAPLTTTQVPTALLQQNNVSQHNAILHICRFVCFNWNFFPFLAQKVMKMAVFLLVHKLGRNKKNKNKLWKDKGKLLILFILKMKNN